MHAARMDWPTTKNEARSLPQDRRIILIDVENYNGGPVTSPNQARWCQHTLDAWIKPRKDDIIVIAADASTVTNIHLAWPSVRILTGFGENGADYKLLDVMEEDLPSRFSEMVLVSGDGIFTDHVDYLAAQGLLVSVYSHSHNLSARLRLAAHAVYTSSFHPESALPTIVNL